MLLTSNYTALPAAGWWRRLMGVAYESIVLFAVVFFFGYAYSAVTQLKSQAGLNQAGLNQAGWNSTGFQIWIFAVLASYFAFFWSRGRQSLPMKTLNLLLLTQNREPVTVLRAFLRYCMVLLLLFGPLALAKFIHPGFAVLALTTFVWTLFDRQSRGLQDILCGTLLVVTPEIRRKRKQA